MLAVAASACLSNRSQPPSAPVEPSCEDCPGGLAYTVLNACLPATVHLDRGEIPVHLEGTLFLPSGADERTRLVFLVPGGFTDRKSWDGTSAGLGRDDHSTLPRVFARNGWAALTIDRLGVGDSQPPPPPEGIHGSEITGEVHLDTLTQAIGSVRSGTYTTSSGTCPGGGPASVLPSVIVAGESYGGFLALGLGAQRTEPLAGGLLFDAGLWGASIEGERYQAECIARHGPSADGYVNGFCADAATVPRSCPEWISYAGTRNATLTAALCRDLARTSEGAGLAADFPGHDQLSTWAAAFQPVPVYFLLGAYDRILSSNEAATGSPSLAAQAAGFDEACSCLGTGVLEADVGHVYFVATHAAEITARMMEWMRSVGLGPHAEGTASTAP